MIHCRQRRRPSPGGELDLLHTLMGPARKTVEGDGTFVEFEFKGDARDPADARAQLDAFVADLGVELGERVNRGYPHMLLGREH